MFWKNVRLKCEKGVGIQKTIVLVVRKKIWRANSLPAFKKSSDDTTP